MEEEDVSSASDAQETILSTLPFFPSALSCLGSPCITCMVLTNHKSSPCRRILFGLSCCDFVSSLICPWQAFLVPLDTSQHAWALGNDASCTTLGFFQQASFCSIWHNAMLSPLFLVTVKCGMREAMVASRLKPWMHLAAVGHPLIAACTGAGLGVCHEIDIGLGCWGTNCPEGCGSGENDTGPCLSEPLAWIFAGIPTFLSFVMILVNDILVCCHVRGAIQQGRMRASRTDPSLQSSSSRLPLWGMLRASASWQRPSMLLRQSQQPPPQAQQSSTLVALRGSTLPSAQGAGRSASAGADSQLKRIWAIFAQASLHVVAFSVCCVPSLTLRIMEGVGCDAEDEDELFPLLVIRALLLPLQGLFNCLICIRLACIRSREQCPRESILWAFRPALLGDKIKPAEASKKRRHNATAASSGAKGSMLQLEEENNKTRTIPTTATAAFSSIVEKTSDRMPQRSQDAANNSPMTVAPAEATNNDMSTSFCDESHGVD